jgi:hypothetical protein
MRKYKIYSVAEELWWNNNLGWTVMQSATWFTSREKDKFILPMGGIWICVKRED